MDYRTFAYKLYMNVGTVGLALIGAAAGALYIGGAKGGAQ